MKTWWDGPGAQSQAQNKLGVGRILSIDDLASTLSLVFDSFSLHTRHPKGVGGPLRPQALPRSFSWLGRLRTEALASTRTSGSSL